MNIKLEKSKRVYFYYLLKISMKFNFALSNYQHVMEYIVALKGLKFGLISLGHCRTGDAYNLHKLIGQLINTKHT